MATDLGSGQILNLIYALENAHVGTGILKLLGVARNLLGQDLPPVLIEYSIGQLNTLFGGYPTRWDVAPSAVFTAVFTIIAFLHLFLFCYNCSRGHFFYISFLWFLYAVVKALGFGLRVGWSLDITRVQMGLTSEVFLIISAVFLVTINLILAQRLFTWRHPVGGDRKLFTNFMYVLYTAVALVVVLTIVASAAPYLYFLSKKSYRGYHICVMLSAILIILYSLTAISLLFLSYFFKPTRKDENLYTYQPWWIESFHPFYFVKKNAARDAEETFMKRNHNHRHAVRVIAATHHHYNMVEGLTNQRGTLEHNKSIMIVTITTGLAFIEAILRAVVCFKPEPAANGFPLIKPIVAYVCWGILEALINILYLVGRVDLRFYKPDILPAKVRSIITAEQSYHPSDNEELEEEEEVEEEYSSSLHFNSTDQSTIPPHYEKDSKSMEKYRSPDNDNDSEFNF